VPLHFDDLLQTLSCHERRFDDSVERALAAFHTARISSSLKMRLRADCLALTRLLPFATGER
jgi:hypothetical protein